MGLLNCRAELLLTLCKFGVKSFGFYIQLVTLLKDCLKCSSELGIVCAQVFNGEKCSL